MKDGRRESLSAVRLEIAVNVSVNIGQLFSLLLNDCGIDADVNLGIPAKFNWWSKGDLNPHASRHMTLNHACLPIPPFDRCSI